MATMRPNGPTRQRDLAAEVERLEHALRLTEARSREALSEMEHLRAQFLQAQKMEPVGRMTAGLAHDFKNTLTLIAGYTDRLLQRVDDPAGREDLAEIRAACNRAIGLSQQLLAFGRHGTASLATLSLNAILADAGKMLRRMLPANVDLAIRPAAAPDLVTANAGQLHQVLLNLVVNARDAMPAGGRLVIETRNADVEPGSAAAASGVAPGDYVRLSVSDTGVGMDEATRKRALEPFFTTKEGRTGTGLGLSTVVEIVSRSHGSIAIESAPGRGTSVLISLPRAAGATEPVAVAAAPGPESRRRVLVVDPDEQVRRLLVDVTSGAGFGRRSGPPT